MRILQHWMPRIVSLLPLALTFVLPLSADKDENAGDRTVTVLYEGPLAHDQNWTIKYGPPGPNNQKFRAFGGTCSMIGGDVHNLSGSGIERVTFESELHKPGVWKMAWTDTVSGDASDGNHYAYQQRFEYTGPTTDGKAPKPSRETPTPGFDGFLQFVPSNVTVDALDLRDFFILQTPAGSVVASSNLHWTLRLQIPPFSTDPPPAFLPFVFPGRFIVNLHDQLAGQLGCDPL